MFWIHLIGSLFFVSIGISLLMISFYYHFGWGLLCVLLVISIGIKVVGSSFFDSDFHRRKFVSGKIVDENEIPYLITHRYSTLFGSRKIKPILGIQAEDDEFVLARLLVSRDCEEFNGKIMNLQDGMGDILYRYSLLDHDWVVRIKRYSAELTDDESIVLAKLREIIPKPDFNN